MIPSRQSRRLPARRLSKLAITAAQVKELRDKTGAGMNEEGNILRAVSGETIGTVIQ